MLNPSSQVVDMRWGVRDEATDDHMTTELCMREIENCQRLSMGPNFVVSKFAPLNGYPPFIVQIICQEYNFITSEIYICSLLEQ